jgi:hypothetical protein
MFTIQSWRGSTLRRWLKKRWLAVSAVSVFLLVALPLAALYAYSGLYGINVLLRRGGSYWVAVAPDSPRLSAAMRVALRDPPSVATAGALTWREVAPGFEVGELPVLADGQEVDRFLLARVDPTRFDFQVRTAPAGNKGPDAWMADLGAVLVINGSYYSQTGKPDTPLVQAGTQIGPANYEARHGAFIASRAMAGIRDLANTNWQAAFAGAHDAMVSYPLLLAADGTNRVTADRRWLANRSFVGEDKAGRIILGTTQDAFFSLDRFAGFLRIAPLGLKVALNLDGGPVACQSIASGSFRRDFCGRWETSVRNGELHLLTWGYGTWALPIVLAVVPRADVAAKD